MPIVAALSLLFAAAGPQGQPADAFAIAGRVVDFRHEGIPVAEVWFEADDAPGLAVARIRTDADGHYRLGGLPRDCRGKVWARADGYCNTAAPANRDHRHATLRLQQAVTLTGTLRDATGRPVANGALRAEPLDTLLEDTFSAATCDEQGRFRLTGVPVTSSVGIVALLGDAGLAFRAVRVDGDAEVTLDPVAATTSLTVTIEGLPDDERERVVASLELGILGSMRMPAPLDRPSLATGRWHAPVLPDWPMSLSLRAPDHTLLPGDVVLRKGNGPHVVQVKATRLRDRAFTIAVKDHDGAPVRGAALACRSLLHDTQTFARTDEAGVASFVHRLGDDAHVTISSVDRGWVVDGRAGLVVDREGQHSVRLARACSVTAQLLTARGRAAAFAEATLQVGLEKASGTYWSSLATTIADEAGAVRFEQLPALARRLRLVTRGPHGALATEPFSLDEPGARARLGALELAATATVEGTVRDERGAPLIGVRVSGRWSGDGQALPDGWSETLTDRDGRYRFVGVPAGAFSLHLPFEREDSQLQVEAGAAHVLDVEIDDD